jgi:hypothetical protein
MKKLLFTLTILTGLYSCTKHVDNHSNRDYNVSYLYFNKCVATDSAGNCTKYVKDSVGLIFNTTN